MSELKPCPFCGGDLVTRHTGWLDHPKAKCILSGKVFHKGFIGQWNLRADITTLSAAMQLPEVRALVVALDECQAALSDFGKAYPHMVKGYMLDAENNATAAIAAIKEPKP